MGYQVGERDGSRRALWAAALVATTAITATAWTAPAFAQADTQRNFDIPAQPLPSALTQFGRQSGLQVSVPAALADGRTSTAVAGALAPVEALSRLLAGTGLTYRISGNIVTLEAVPQASGSAIQLGPVRVEGQSGPADASAPPQAVLGNLPPVYAGGQVATGGQLGLLGNRSVMDAPFNMTSYTSKLAQDQQARTLADIVQNDPSIRYIGSPDSYTEDFSIRGFQSLDQDVYFNGLGGIIPLQIVNPDYLERIDILKGTNALLYGISSSGSIGGAINVVPKHATDQPITDLTVTYDSQAEFGGHLDFGRRFGDNNQWGIRFNGTLRGGDTAFDHSSERLGDAFVGLDYRGDRLRVSLDGGYNSHKITGLYDTAASLGGDFDFPAPPKSGQNLFPSWGHVLVQDTFGVARAEYDVAPNWTIFAAAGGRHNTGNLLGGIELIEDSVGNALFFPRANQSKANTFSTQIGTKSDFDTGPINHQLSASLNYYQFKQYFAQTIFSSQQANIYDAEAIAMPDLSGYSGMSPLTYISKFSSAAIGDTLSILDRKVQLTVGGRVQRVQTTNYDATSGAVTTRYDRTAVTPAVGFVVKPWKNISLYANYIEGLSPGTVVPSIYANAGAALAPYVSRQFEVGVKADWGKFTTTADVFQITQPTGAADPVTNIYSDDAKQRNRGLEINTFGEVMKGVRVLGGITLIDGRLTHTTSAATQAPVGQFAVNKNGTQVRKVAESRRYDF